MREAGIGMPSPNKKIIENKSTPSEKLKVGKHPWIQLAMVCVGYGGGGV